MSQNANPYASVNYRPVKLSSRIGSDTFIGLGRLPWFLFRLQNSLAFAMYILANSTVNNWEDWEIPHETLFWVAHALLWTMDRVDWASVYHRENHVALTFTGYHIHLAVATMAIIADGFTVGRQIGRLKESNVSVDNKVQMAFVSFSLFISFLRLGFYNLSTKPTNRLTNEIVHGIKSQ